MSAQSPEQPPFDFDAVDPAAKRASRGEKWATYPPDALPLWVADMDFALAPPIRRVLERAVATSDLGYPIHPAPTDLPDVFAARARERFGWAIEPRSVELLTDVVQGMIVGVDRLSAPGDGVVVQTPIYRPFLRVVEEFGRRLRVFRRAELEAVAEIALSRGLFVVSDEISADLVLSGERFVPFASLGPDVAARTLTLSSASKAFNIAGLRTAVGVFGSDEVRRRFLSLPRHVRGGIGILGLEATRAAWLEGGPWLDAALDYLRGNRELVARTVRDSLPGVVYHPGEATYLAWLDCRALGLRPSPFRFFLEKAKVALSDGPSFGAPGEGFVRLNFATSRAILSEALERMAKALSER
jgi:cystathionine beta-lyase